jgi:mRNA interferase MazF
VSGAPKQGEVWLANLDPVVGGEVQKTRPVLVLTRNEFNDTPLRIVLAVPLTTTPGPKLHVRVEIPDQTPRRVSYAMPEQTRALSRHRLIKRLGELPLEPRQEIARRLRLITHQA